MKASRQIGIGVVLVGLAVALYLATSWRGSGEAPDRAEAFVVPGAPSAVYEAILPEMRDRVARETKIVRVDGPGVIEVRFSAYLEDHTVRLVQLRLEEAPAASTRVSIESRRFSFVPGRPRDAQDAALEHSLAGLIRRHTEGPGHPG